MLHSYLFAIIITIFTIVYAGGVKIQKTPKLKTSSSSYTVNHPIPGLSYLTIRRLSNGPFIKDKVLDSRANKSHLDDFDVEELTKQASPLLDLSFDELTNEILELCSKLTYTSDYSVYFPNKKPDAQQKAWHEAMGSLGMLYYKTQDPQIADRCVFILYHLAQQILKLNPDYEFTSWNPVHAVPANCIWMYDLTYNSGAWERLDKKLHTNTKQLVEDWFLLTANTFISKAKKHGFVWNLHPSPLSAILALGFVLNDPMLVREALLLTDDYLLARGANKEIISVDGWYKEGTLAYQNQVSNLTLPIYEAIETYWKDPEGYVDTTYDLTLNHTNFLDDVSRSRALKMKQVLAKFRFPNGAQPPIHDAPIPKEDMDIQAQWIKNHEFPQFGHYAMTHGDAKNATQVHLHYSPFKLGPPYGGGHEHADDLSLILFAGGQDVLPDAGYPPHWMGHGYKYYQRSYWGHNVSHAYFFKDKEKRIVADSSSLNRSWIHPFLHYYDNGKDNDKTVQVIKASALGSPEKEVLTERDRSLVLIQADKQRSYVFDMFRLCGGDIHESYLRPYDQGSVTQTVSKDLTNYNGDNLQQLLNLNFDHKSSWWTHYWKDLKNPTYCDNSEAFNFCWKTDDYGTSLRTYINPSPDTTAYFSKGLRLGGVPWNKKDWSKEDSFPYTHHFLRHREVSNDQTTQFAAIYDTWRKNEKPLIQKVHWITLPSAVKNSSTLVKVQGSDFYDYIWNSSNPLASYEYKGMKFTGELAIIRFNNNHKTQWIYCASDSQLSYHHHSVKGKSSQQLAITSVYRNENNGTYYFDVKGLVNKSTLKKDDWIYSNMPQSFGYGHSVKSIEQLGNNTRIYLQQDPGFVIKGSKIQQIGFPNLQFEDEATVIIKTPTFKKFLK